MAEDLVKILAGMAVGGFIGYEVGSMKKVVKIPEDVESFLSTFSFKYPDGREVKEFKAIRVTDDYALIEGGDMELFLYFTRKEPIKVIISKMSEESMRIYYGGAFIAELSSIRWEEGYDVSTMGLSQIGMILVRGKSKITKALIGGYEIELPTKPWRGAIEVPGVGTVNVW